MPREPLLLLTLANLLAESFQLSLVRCAEASTQKPANLSRELGGAETLMQGAGDFNPSGDLAGRLEFAESLVASGDDLGEIFVERQGTDVG